MRFGCSTNHACGYPMLGLSSSSLPSSGAEISCACWVGDKVANEMCPSHRVSSQEHDQDPSQTRSVGYYKSWIVSVLLERLIQDFHVIERLYQTSHFDFDTWTIYLEYRGLRVLRSKLNGYEENSTLKEHIPYDGVRREKRYQRGSPKSTFQHPSWLHQARRCRR
jgi:hypothetical protein